MSEFVSAFDLFVMIKGKLELKDDTFSLHDKIIISYGISGFYKRKDNDCKFSFLFGESCTLKIKIETKSINVIIVENNNDETGEILIKDNFLKNPIILKGKEENEKLIFKLDKIIVYQMEENN